MTRLRLDPRLLNGDELPDELEQGRPSVQPMRALQSDPTRSKRAKTRTQRRKNERARKDARIGKV